MKVSLRHTSLSGIMSYEYSVMKTEKQYIIHCKQRYWEHLYAEISDSNKHVWTNTLGKCRFCVYL